MVLEPSLKADPICNAGMNASNVKYTKVFSQHSKCFITYGERLQMKLTSQNVKMFLINTGSCNRPQVGFLHGFLFPHD